METAEELEKKQGIEVSRSTVRRIRMCLAHFFQVEMSIFSWQYPGNGLEVCARRCLRPVSWKLVRRKLERAIFGLGASITGYKWIEKGVL